MLGKLFNLGAGNAATNQAPAQTHPSKQPPQPSLESVQEDIHTRHLLFPDAAALLQHHNDQVFPLATPLPMAAAAASAFDYDDDIDLETRHVRVLIMQDAAGPYPSQLLFDSQGPPPAPPSTLDRSSPATPNVQDARRTPNSPRKSSLNQSSRPVVVQPDSPGLRHGAFDRRASLHGRTQSSAETELQRARREYNDEINAFSSCTFGNSELMAYKGTSTKVHVVPGQADIRNDYVGSVFGDGRGSIGRSSMRSSRLAQSFTSETVSPSQPSPSFVSSASTHRHGPERKKILITRLFPVSLASDDEAHSDSPVSRFSDQNTGFPFPPHEEAAPKKKKTQPKQKRTPMYAVVLVIQLPPSQSQPIYPSAPRSASRGPGSYQEPDSFPLSWGSARRSGWPMTSSGFHNESLESSMSSDLDDRMDAVTQHWDIIMRTLTQLQSAVASVLSIMLKQEDVKSPDPYAPPIASFVARTPSLSRRGDDPHLIKPPKSNSKLIALQSQRLQQNELVAQAATKARVRIVSGLRAQRAITGQGRWGIWRDEARWMARGAGDIGQSFFYRLLTGFLAAHTDWLQALGSLSFRKRNPEQQRAKGEEDLVLPARTVIISRDKMLARRLVFLLSAFLPDNQQLSTARPHRPSTSASIGPFSQSPPSYVVPILREESLRRKLNRRTRLRTDTHSRNVSQSARTSGVPTQLAHLAMESNHDRRPSDAGSIRSTLPMTSLSGQDSSTMRKSSAATTTTITPETSIPHFSSVHRVESRRSQRPGSSSSVAADDLKRSLRRGETSGHASTASTDSRASSSKWGSMISGLWSNTARRGSSSMTVHDTSDSGPTSPVKLVSDRPNKLTQMVREVTPMEGQGRADDPRPSIESHDPGTPRGFVDEQAIDDEPERLLFMERTPDPTGAFQSPVKTSINPDDGVIDVDIPFPDYIASFETAVSSPSSSGYLSTPGLTAGLDGFEQLSRMAVDGDLPINVGGFIQRFHQDFALQAIPPQEGLMDQIKQSMKSEPTPFVTQRHVDENLTDRWIDMSSVIIADAASQTVKRLRYRRLVRPKPGPGHPAAALSSASSSFYGTAAFNPQALLYETQLEDEFIEEDVTSLDDVLIGAVERVVAQGVDSLHRGKHHHESSSSSRSTSKGRERRDSEGSRAAAASGVGVASSRHSNAEVPRGECKAVILGALQDIIREVIDQREQETPQGSNGDSGTTNTDTDADNILREAVRGWLDGMDRGD